MKKPSLLLVILVLTYTTRMSATPIDPATALRVAENYLTSSSTKTPRRMVRQNASDGQQYYIYQGTDSCGYVIVAADDVAHPVLGYSPSGYIDTDNMPDNMRAWLGNYSQQISWAQQHAIEQDATISQEWDELVHNQVMAGEEVVVGPLLNSIWAQGSGYNAKCPYDSNRRSCCATGCVATAMAQIMYYWAYPQQGIGSHSYKHATYGTLSADFGNTTYRWSQMANRITSSTSSTCVKEISQLMYHCGVAVDMDYGVDGSGAYDKDVVVAMKEYFGYDERTKIYMRDAYQDAMWKEMVKKQLSQFGPVYYSGNSGGSSGHAFVLDGYTSNDKFHINWGWGGSENGYFALNAFNPDTMSFNQHQQAIFYMIPKGDTIAGSRLELDDSLYVYYYPIQPATFEYLNKAYSSDSIEVYAKIMNIGNRDYTGTFRAVLRDSTSMICATSAEVSKTILSKAKSVGVSMRFNNLKHLSLGTYVLSVQYSASKNKFVDCDSTYYGNTKPFLIISKPNSVPLIHQDVSSDIPYNVIGQRVNKSYQGVVITKGRKLLFEK